MADRRIIVYQTTSLTGEPSEPEAAPAATPEPVTENPILLQTGLETSDWGL